MKLWTMRSLNRLDQESFSNLVKKSHWDNLPHVSTLNSSADTFYLYLQKEEREVDNTFLLIRQTCSVVCSTFVLTVDCTASNKIDVQLMNTKHVPKETFFFFFYKNPGTCSFFPYLRKELDQTRRERGSKAVPYLPVTLLAQRTVWCQ